MVKKIIEIKEDICKNTRLYNQNIYVVEGEIHIKTGVKLAVEDDTEIYIKNGLFRDKFNTIFVRSKLIFDSGSILKADKVFFKACDDTNSEVQVAENGGVYFVGTALFVEKDSISTNQNAPPSSFRAKLISTSYLGSADIVSTTEKKEYLSNIDDYDAISVLGVNEHEWKIKNIYSEYSGDDGFDLQNSNIWIESVIVFVPAEDGLNVVNSTLNITKKLVVDMEITANADRDIFDLENDTRYSLIKLLPKCKVNINGIFGDQLILSSSDLPPNKCILEYKFNGRLGNGETLIFTTDYLTA
jgi:hypothetical protein